MAKPTTRSWSKLSIWVGDGADPEDFTSKVCGLRAKTFRISGTTSDQEVPDCDDPDLAVWIERIERALSAAISGSGTMAEETFAFWRDWKLSAGAKNVRVVLALTATGYFYGRFLLTEFELTASLDDGKIGVSVSLVSDGPVAWQAGEP